MDLEKAYNKIDNFCCSNHNTLQGNTVRYLNGREETINMFDDYQENKDDDFCKDVYEMTDALETIKRVVDLQKEFGCPLDVRERAFDNGFYDIDGNHYFCEHYVPYLKSMHTRGISIGRERHFKLKDYKITWWLREDKSE